MTFKKGVSGNPAGKPIGARNKLQTNFLQDLYSDWREHGADVLRAMRVADPSGYVRVVAGLVPTQHEEELRVAYVALMPPPVDTVDEWLQQPALLPKPSH